jgi:hydantoinase/carbamoylase family amidase
MPISVERIQSDLTAIARFSDPPGPSATLVTGTNRLAFSPAWRQARDYVQTQLESIGCHLRVDAAGNLHARPSAIAWTSPAWMSGSHLDTLPNGGNYDGIVGVIAALEALRAAREDLKISIPLEMVVWAASDPATFGMGMLGSRAIVGAVDLQQLGTLKNALGQSYLEAGAAHGVLPDRIASDRLNPVSVVGFIEVHPEEGPSLWNLGVSVGCATEVTGRRHYRCELEGHAGHAGTTPMRDRLDALAGAAEAIVILEKLAHEMGHHTLITIGQLTCKPNAINRIAERVTFTIDMRCTRMPLMANGDQAIRKNLDKIVERRKLRMKIDVAESQPVVELDKRVNSKMRKSAASRRIESIADMPCGTFHDAAVLAGHLPSGLLLVPSRDGISHAPAEFTPAEDIAAAVGILMETVRDRRLD